MNPKMIWSPIVAMHLFYIFGRDNIPHAIKYHEIARISHTD
jgi:hypothetical protein